MSELCDSMSAHELSIQWPAFFEARERMRQAEEDKQRQAL